MSELDFEQKRELINNFFRGWFSAMDGTVTSRASIYEDTHLGKFVVKSIVRGTPDTPTSDRQDLEEFIALIFDSIEDNNYPGDVSHLSLSFYEVADAFLENPTITYKWLITHESVVPDYEVEDDKEHYGWLLDPRQIPEHSENTEHSHSDDDNDENTHTHAYHSHAAEDMKETIVKELKKSFAEMSSGFEASKNALSTKEQKAAINNIFSGWFSTVSESTSYRATISAANAFLGADIPIQTVVLSATKNSSLQNQEKKEFEDFISFLQSCMTNSAAFPEKEFLLDLAIYDAVDPYHGNPSTVYNWAISRGNIRPDYRAKTSMDQCGWDVDPHNNPSGPDEENIVDENFESDSGRETLASANDASLKVPQNDSEATELNDEQEVHEPSVLSPERVLEAYFDSVTTVSARDVLTASEKQIHAAEAIIHRAQSMSKENIIVVDIDVLDFEGEDIPFMQVDPVHGREVSVGQRLLVLGCDEGDLYGHSVPESVSHLAGLIHRTESKYYNEYVTRTLLTVKVFDLDDAEQLADVQVTYQWSIENGRITPSTVQRWYGEYVEENITAGW